jgi:hypothetical protein
LAEQSRVALVGDSTCLDYAPLVAEMRAGRVHFTAAGHDVLAEAVALTIAAAVR